MSLPILSPCTYQARRLPSSVPFNFSSPVPVGFLSYPVLGARMTWKNVSRTATQTELARVHFGSGIGEFPKKNGVGRGSMRESSLVVADGGGKDVCFSREKVVNPLGDFM